MEVGTQNVLKEIAGTMAKAAEANAICMQAMSTSLARIAETQQKILQLMESQPNRAAGTPAKTKGIAVA